MGEKTVIRATAHKTTNEIKVLAKGFIVFSFQYTASSPRFISQKNIIKPDYPPYARGIFLKKAVNHVGFMAGQTENEY
jgi:hypothetical protein